MFQKFCAIVLFACAFGISTAKAEPFSERFISANPATAAPPMTFEDAKGRTLSLKDFAGRYVLLNLWATWCAPCVHELPALNNLQAKFPRERLTVIALAEDVNARQGGAASFYSRHGISNLGIYADTAGNAPSFMRAHGMPTSYLIDPHGRVMGYVEGDADWATPEAIAFVKSQVGG